MQKLKVYDDPQDLVTAKLTQHLLSNGKNETNLYTDMTNPTSNKVYMDVGYEFVCDSVHFGVNQSSHFGV